VLSGTSSLRSAAARLGCDHKLVRTRFAHYRRFGESGLCPTRKSYRGDFKLKVSLMARSTFYYHLKKSKDPDKYSPYKEEITRIYHSRRDGMKTSAIKTRGRRYSERRIYSS